MQRLALVALVIAAACGDGAIVDGGSPGPLPVETILGVPVPVHERVRVTGRTTTVEAFDDYFLQTVLTGTPGAEVKIVLRNGGTRRHNFSLPEQDATVDVPPGDIREADVRFPPAGTLAFFCRYHRDTAGMIGALRAR